MNIFLTQELEKFVHKKVRTGLYNSASEFVCGALCLLQKREERLAKLEHKVAVGLNSLNRGEGQLTMTSH